MKNVKYINHVEEWRKEFVFSKQTTIRFSETDMFGHMNNVSPFIYFEEARIAFLTEVGLFTNIHEVAAIPVVADLQCDFHKQLFFNQIIQTYVKAVHIGTTSFDVHYMVVDETGDIVLTGRGRLVQMEKETGKPCALSDENKNKLRAYISIHS